MFTRKLVKLKGIHGSFPTALGFSNFFLFSTEKFLFLDRMRNVANDGLTKLRRLNAINADPEQHLNLSKSLDGLNERSNGPDGRRQIPDRD